MKYGRTVLFGILVAAGFVIGPALAQTDILIPSATPFGYNVGINYETDLDGRTGRSITADLNQITQYFELVRTYHDTAAPNSTTPTIDPNQLQVIQYAMTHSALSIVMGTYDSALVTGTTGNFGPGLMDNPAYTDAWVQMVIGAFGGSTAAVAHSLKTILLGNELDYPEPYIPDPNDPSYSTYVKTWIPTALANLQSSLSKAGLGNIPVSVSLAYSPVSAPAGDSLSTFIPQYITTYWSRCWNGGQPFVLYDQYSNSSPPTFNDVSGYLRQVAASANVQNEVFLAETGVQSPGGNDAQEAAFYQLMFAFLGGEQQNTGITLPSFVFQAFDLPAENQSYGLFSQDANSQPTGLKPGISIPPWIAQPAPAGSALLGAMLPSSRSVEVGATATAFATVINNGLTDALSCAITPRTGIAASFAFQTTNPTTNALTGTLNTPVNIPPGRSQSFVIAFTPNAALAPTNVAFNFACANAAPAPTFYGLDTLLLSASTTPTPDVVALAATLQNDGIVHVTGAPTSPNGPPTGVFPVATVNLGSADTIIASTNTGEAPLPITVTICQTNPQTGVCLQTPGLTVAATINANATPTFGIFVSASGTVAFDPANSRIFVQFTDSIGAVRGETSVAIETM